MSVGFVYQCVGLVALCVLFYCMFLVLNVATSEKVNQSVIKNNLYAIGVLFLISIPCAVFGLKSITQSTSVYLLFWLAALSIALLYCIHLLRHCVLALSNPSYDDSSSTIDTVTRIYNRQYIEARLADEVARSKRYSSPLTVLMIDICNFHLYNTEYGFQAGDRLLKTTASIIVSSVRESDVVARYGEDRFLIILTDTPESCCTAIINRLQSNISGHISTLIGATEGQKSANVKFGKAWCGVNTRDGGELISNALDRIQAEKSSLNKQDTSVIESESSYSKVLDRVA